MVKPVPLLRTVMVPTMMVPTMMVPTMMVLTMMVPTMMVPTMMVSLFHLGRSLQTSQKNLTRSLHLFLAYLFH